MLPILSQSLVGRVDAVALVPRDVELAVGHEESLETRGTEEEVGWTAASALLNLVSYIPCRQMDMVTYQCPLFAASEPPTAAAITASTVTTASARLKETVLNLRP